MKKDSKVVKLFTISKENKFYVINGQKNGVFQMYLLMITKNILILHSCIRVL